MDPYSYMNDSQPTPWKPAGGKASKMINFPPDLPPSKIISIKIKPDFYLPPNHVILTYSPLATGKVDRLKAKEDGVVKEILVAVGDTVQGGTPLLSLAPCPHPTVMREMCANCGKDLKEDKQQKLVSMIHSVPELKVSAAEAEVISKIDEERLLVARKLVLLVDLDQTLIHTTNDNVEGGEDTLHFSLPHHNIFYHTRLRPGTRSFLSHLHPLFELHICTFGTNAYAHVIAKFLDPEGEFFGDRILSRDECFSQNNKTANLKELFPRGDHMVCIIDDREDVWNFAPNLIHVKAYHYYRHTGDINAPEGLGKMEDSEVGVDSDSDDYLIYLEGILKSIHSAFYAMYDEDGVVPDVKSVIPYVKKKVLKGTSLCFSGLIPTQIPPSERKNSAPYRLATSLGAIVTEEIVPPGDKQPATTHLVAARLGTAKVNEARRWKIQIVSPEWLFCSGERWERADERVFRGFRGKLPLPRKTRTPSGRFMDTINPLLSFSKVEIESMGHEVDDEIDSSDSSSEEVKKRKVDDSSSDDNWMAEMVEREIE